MADHDYREFYEKDYLGAWNLTESGELTLTMIECLQGELNSPGVKKTTKKPVLRFKETDKKMALNVTNGKTIATLYGNKVSAWAGKRITLFKSMTRNPAGGDDVECLRVRPKVPSAPKESASAQVSAPILQTPSPGAIGAPASAADLITPDQIAAIETRCQDAGVSLDKLKAAVKVDALAMIPATSFARVQDWIGRAIDARQAA
jgi:hypothetical protein